VTRKIASRLRRCCYSRASAQAPFLERVDDRLRFAVVRFRAAFFAAWSVTLFSTLAAIRFANFFGLLCFVFFMFIATSTGSSFNVFRVDRPGSSFPKRSS